MTTQTAVGKFILPGATNTYEGKRATTNPHRRIAAHEVRRLCGDVSDMWLYRRLNDSDFPKPIYIGRRRFWREAEVIAWLDAQPSEGAT